jgi:hypothetical protein
LNHIMEKNAEYRGLQTPSEVLRDTKVGFEGVNEIVIRGTGPTGRTVVSVSGFFIRVNHQGKIEWDDQNDPRLKKREDEFRLASRKFMIPIVYIKPSWYPALPKSRSGSLSSG